MKTYLAISLAAMWPSLVVAQNVAAAPSVTATDAVEATGAPDAPLAGAEVTLEDFLWTARPVVVFADTDADPAFQRQMELLRARPEPLADRDVVVIVDTDPGDPSDLRRTLRPRGFSVVLVGKDGRVIRRVPSPWDVREITGAIDRTPQGRQEIQERVRGR